MQIIVYSAEVDGGGGGGEMGVEEGGVDSLTDMYDDLPPLEKLERYFQSEDVLDRYGIYLQCKYIIICTTIIIQKVLELYRMYVTCTKHMSEPHSQCLPSTIQT